MKVKGLYLIDLALHFPMTLLEGIMPSAYVQIAIIAVCSAILRRKFGEAIILKEMATACSICLTIECRDARAKLVIVPLPDLSQAIGREITAECGRAIGVIMLDNVGITFRYAENSAGTHVIERLN